VYAVATTDNLDDDAGLRDCPLDAQAIRQLLQVRAEAAVDGVSATEASLATRLGQMWIPGQPVAYIGLAGSSVAYRIGQFYRTPLGARAPHAGGWPIKMLRSGLLWVHYASSNDPDGAEGAMAAAFGGGLPVGVRTALFDVNAPVPFANLMVPGGARKRHGLSGVKEARITAGRAGVSTRTIATPIRPVARLVGAVSVLRTQNVTAGDISRGMIRVPGPTKRAFPSEATRITVDLMGETLTGCRWDPKYGPDKERSGTISIPSGVLQRVVRPRGPLTVTQVEGGVRLS